MRTAIGRRMTERARRSHEPSPSDDVETRRTANRSRRGPITVSTAGSSVSAATTASPTTSAPAIPTLRRIMKSKSTRPSSPSRTVNPLKNTARPAVATVSRTASATSASVAEGRLASSSR